MKLPAIASLLLACVLGGCPLGEDEDARTALSFLAAGTRHGQASIGDTLRLVLQYHNPGHDVESIEWTIGGPEPVTRTTQPGRSRGADTVVLVPKETFTTDILVAVTDGRGKEERRSFRLEIVEDPPEALAGNDTAVWIGGGGTGLELRGGGTDGFGRIVKWEWRIGSGAPFRESPDGRISIDSLPPSGRSMVCVLQVTDDDGMTARDSLTVSSILARRLQPLPLPDGPLRTMRAFLHATPDGRLAGFVYGNGTLQAWAYDAARNAWDPGPSVGIRLGEGMAGIGSDSGFFVFSEDVSFGIATLSVAEFDFAGRRWSVQERERILNFSSYLMTSQVAGGDLFLGIEEAESIHHLVRFRPSKGLQVDMGRDSLLAHVVESGGSIYNWATPRYDGNTVLSVLDPDKQLWRPITTFPSIIPTPTLDIHAVEGGLMLHHMDVEDIRLWRSYRYDFASKEISTGTHLFNIPKRVMGVEIPPFTYPPSYARLSDGRILRVQTHSDDIHFWVYDPAPGAGWSNAGDAGSPGFLPGNAVLLGDSVYLHDGLGLHYQGKGPYFIAMALQGQ